MIERFSNLKNLQSIGFVSLDRHLRVTSWNAYMENLFQIDEISALGSHFQELIPPTGASIMELRFLQECLEQRQRKIFATTHRGFHGIPFKLEFEVSPLIEQDEVQGCLLTIQNITEKSRSAFMLRQSMSIGKVAFFFQLVEPSAVLESDSLLSLLGIRKFKDFRLEMLELIVDETSKTAVAQGLDQLRKNQGITTFDFRITNQGKTQWFHCRCQKDLFDSGTMLVGSIQDVSERVMAAINAQEKEEKHSRLIKTFPAVVIQMGLSSTGELSLPFVSTQCQDILGVSEDEIIVQGKLLQYIPKVELKKLIKTLDSSHKSSQKVDFEMTYLHPKKGERFLRILGEPVMVDSKCLWDGIIFDETSSKEQMAIIERSRSQLEQSTRLSILGTALAGVVHDIAQPLTVIRSTVEIVNKMVQGSEPNMESMKRLLKILEKSSKHLNSVISGLKRFSRNGADDQFSKVELKTILEDALIITHSQASKNEVIVQSELEDDLMISGISSEITQVMINLLSNSIDAIHQLPEKWVKILGRKTSSHVVIDMIDSGQGIPQQIADKMMEAFFTTKPEGKGTGLGLSICRKIVLEHSGNLELNRSSPNTHFVLKFPLYDPHRKKVSLEETQEVPAAIPFKSA